jgi:hypothetical protein
MVTSGYGIRNNEWLHIYCFKKKLSKQEEVGWLLCCSETEQIENQARSKEVKLKVSGD